MVARIYTVAFEGIDARAVEVQCATAPGIPAFSIVGLPDKAVVEARERVRSALSVMSIALPSRRITINLSPADLPKAGSHYDLPIALALLTALEIIPHDTAAETLAMGELSLDGSLVGVMGALPAALTAAEAGQTLVVPKASGPEAAWVDNATVIAADSLAQLIGHFTGQSPLAPATPGETLSPPTTRDMRDVKGQERAKRALEIAAAGRHHLLMTGPPGSGKSMLAARLPGLLPPLTPAEALETSMVHSLAGLIDEGGINMTRPFREPHHTASMAAIVGGGRRAGPGEISLAHNGVLFLDELPEFSQQVLDTLRQPIETGEVMVARANAHVKYPCRFMLVAAANPCRCGYLGDAAKACSRVPHCGEDYMGRISGPMMDRFDLRVDAPAVSLPDLQLPADGETSQTIAERVATAWQTQRERYADIPNVTLNSEAHGDVLEQAVPLDAPSKQLIAAVADRFGLSARGFHRILRVARTIADLAGVEVVTETHVAEAVSYRLNTPATSGTMPPRRRGSGLPRAGTDGQKAIRESDSL